MPPPDNRSVVQAFYDQWNSGAIDFDRLVDEDVMNHQPARDPETGLDMFRKAIAGVMGAVPDSKWTTLNLIEEGELVVCHNRWTGTFGGTVFRGIPTPKGKHFSVEHLHVYRVVDGRIAEHWVVRDDLGMMLQIGAITAGPQERRGLRGTFELDLPSPTRSARLLRKSGGFEGVSFRLVELEAAHPAAADRPKPKRPMRQL